METDLATAGRDAAMVETLAAERDQDIVAAGRAVGASEPVREDAATQVIMEGVLDVERDVRGEVLVRAGGGEIGLEVFEHGFRAQIARLDAFQRMDGEGRRRVEPGDFEISVGQSSADVAESTTLTVVAKEEK